MKHVLGLLSLVSSVVFATEPCGTVSVFFEGPETKSLYDARIGAINGKSTLLDVKEHRLTPGKYDIGVYELIDAPELGVDKRHRGYSKTLQIQVEPNKVYRVAAKFLSGNSLNRKNFWEPVVWQIDDKECKD